MKRIIAILAAVFMCMTIYAENKIIVTSFYPMYIFTKNVTKDIEGVTVINMTNPQTGCLHDYSLTTDNMKTLEKASIFVINGHGMESFMRKVISSYPGLSIVEAGKGIPTIKTSGEDNPHLWVSVSNAILQTNEIAKQLGDIDKKNRDKYYSNAKIYTKKLLELRDLMHKNIDIIPEKNIVTFHEAFPYFAKEFNMKIVSTIQREPGSEPSAKELAATINMIRKTKAKAIYAEPQYAPKAAETIAKETGIKVYVLDPIVSGPDDMNAYVNIMEKNMEVLKESLR